MQKAMEQMNIKLSTVLSDITGLSGRRIITAILQGQRNIYELAALAEPNCKASQEDIALSLEGTWDVDLLFMLKQSLAAYDFFLSQVGECDMEIERLLSLYGAQIEAGSAELIRCKRKNKRSKNAPRMDIENFAYQLWGVNVFEIPGLKDTAVMHLIGELGHDFVDKFVSIPSTPFFYIKKALADFVYQLKPLLITQRKSFCNCREATSRSPLRSDRLGGAVRFP